MSRILYITVDGLLQHLGHSQIVRYLERLADRGFEFTILSLERASDLADSRRIKQLERDLEAQGIDWRREQYSEGSGVDDVVQNVATALSRALEISRDQEIELIHARSYVACGIAYFVRMLVGVPYLFDIRGYWIDERLEDDRWFTNPIILGAARLVERELYQRAAGVVSLTKVAKEDIQNGKFGAWDDDTPVEVIPTCADYDDFVTSQEQPIDDIPDDAEPVVGFIGSVKSAYFVDECLEVFERIRDQRESAHLLCATAQLDEMRRRIENSSIPQSATSVLCVPHDRMPRVLAALDWGFLLVEETTTRRAMMPTKLAEFFAAGVRPVYYGCNNDVRSWIERADSGVVLENIEEKELARAASIIAQPNESIPEDLGRARDLTRAHFGLDTGIDAYVRLYHKLL